MSSLKQKLLKGEAVLGTMLSELANPNIVRIMKMAGFDFIIVDCEHGYFDFPQLAAIASLGNGFQLPVLTRIPTTGREFITKALDMSCDGLLVPMVNTAEEARRVVEFAKYQPVGHRGISTVRAHTSYNPPPLSEYMAEANNRTIILLQIETKAAVMHAKEIAKIEGVDALMIGPNDLAADLGTPGQMETPEMEVAIREVLTAAEEAGKSCGIISSKMPFLQKWRKEGMNVFSCGSEVGMMITSAKNTVKTFHAAGDKN